MSNLKLPTLTYGNLDRLLGTRKSKMLAYATTAERHGDLIFVLHHGSPIVWLQEDSTLFAVRKAGYNSSTTTRRLHQALKDNNIAENIGMRQRITSVIRDRSVRPMPRDRWVTWIDGELQEYTLTENA